MTTWEGATKPTEKAEFGRAAGAYAAHRLGFPLSMYERLQVEGVLKLDMDHLDLGTGTGTLARTTKSLGLNSSGRDIDVDMLATAEKIAEQAGLDMSFSLGSAEETSAQDASYDLVSAGQCWHWFDRPKAAAEAFRILRSGGKLLMCHYDWIPYAGNVVKATEELILAHAPDWTAYSGNGIYPLWFQDLGTAGFADIQSFSYDEPAVYSHESWVLRIEASAGIARLSPEKRAHFKDMLKGMLHENFPEDPLHTHHRVFCVWGTKP